MRRRQERGEEREAWANRRGVRVGGETRSQERVWEAMMAEESDERLVFNVVMRRMGWGEELVGWKRKLAAAGIWQAWFERIGEEVEELQEEVRMSEESLRQRRLEEEELFGPGRRGRARGGEVRAF